MANVREDMLLQKRVDQFQREYGEQVYTVNHLQKPFRRDLERIFKRQKQIHNSRLELLGTLEQKCRENMHVSQQHTNKDTDLLTRKIKSAKSKSATKKFEENLLEEKVTNLKELIKKEVKIYKKRYNRPLTEKELFVKTNLAAMRENELKKEELAMKQDRFLNEANPDITRRATIFDFPALNQSRRISTISNLSSVSSSTRPYSAPSIDGSASLKSSSRPGSSCSSLSSGRPESPFSSVSRRSSFSRMPFRCKSPIPTPKSPITIFNGRSSPKIYMCKSRKNSLVKSSSATQRKPQY